MNYKDSMSNYVESTPCEYGTWCDADVIIVLEKGDMFQVCKEHIVPMITQVATTDNPVHSIEEIN